MSNHPWPAPAKLNLFLHIVGRRADGYHCLQTVFQFIDYCDYLGFNVTGDGVIRRVTEVPGIAAVDDLSVRAALALQQYSGCPYGAEIHIDKRLPLGGGLGGGSSDAATTLVALNHLWGLELDPGQLAKIALSLGADIPIFVHGHAAWAEGVGEVLAPVDLDEPWYVVITPPVGIATRTVFSDAQLTRDCRPITISSFLSGQCTNVCEAVVRRRYPEVSQALDALSKYAPARLSGTGSSIFAVFSGEDEAREVLARLSPHWQGVVAKGLNRSPLAALLEQGHGSSADGGP